MSNQYEIEYLQKRVARLENALNQLLTLIEKFAGALPLGVSLRNHAKVIKKSLAGDLEQ